MQDVAIDRQTILEIRERINKLKKTAPNSPEILRLEQYIKNSTHGGKGKALVDANEKSRQAVTNAVNRAITAIEKHHKSLATHLKNNIERGKIYIYKPEKNTNWQ